MSIKEFFKACLFFTVGCVATPLATSVMFSLNEENTILPGYVTNAKAEPPKIQSYSVGGPAIAMTGFEPISNGIAISTSPPLQLDPQGRILTDKQPIRKDEALLIPAGSTSIWRCRREQ